MFFKHSALGVSPCSESADGIIRHFPESPVNPMYKPRTLGELRAIFDHTGINPAPVPLRPGIQEIEGVDPMDTPSVPIGGDVFEIIRTGQALESDIKQRIDDFKSSSVQDSVLNSKSDMDKSAD